MYSPSGIVDPTSNATNNTNTDDLLINNCGMASNYNQNSVDSLLMLNQQYSPPSSSLNYKEPSQNQMNQLQNNQPNQNVTYRRVRPEALNEKTLVDSMVGYFHDVIGSSDYFNKQHSLGATKRPQQHNIFQSGQSTLLSKIPSNSPSSASEIKEQVEWLHFENINLLNSTFYTSNSWNLYNNGTNSNSTSSSFPANQASSKANVKFQNVNLSTANILLVLGYKTGFSIWIVDLNGVATEVLSIREPNITHVKLLQLNHPTKVLIAICKCIQTDNDPPQTNNTHENTNLSSNTDTESQSNSHIPTNNSEPQQTQQIAIVNLLNGECLHEILFAGTVLDMKSNNDLLCVNSWNRIDAFDLNNFEHRFSLNSCFSQISKSSGKSTNPFTLGSRWLAFADKKFHGILSSQGGVNTEIEQSYTATVLNTAKSISKGLVKLSETVVNSVVSKSKNANSNCSSSDHSPRGFNTGKHRNDSKEDYQPGICTILDTKKYVSNARKSQILHDENQSWIVAHFFAHQEPIYALQFNHSGRLLVSADCLGQYFNVFQINTNSFKCTRTIVKHLYSLYRGDTSSKVRNMSFSADSRWLAIGTKRGTTHIFPINCYGGMINARTHSKPYVVNRTTKHQRTAGFVENEEGSFIPGNSNNSNNYLNSSNLSSVEIQQTQMQQMLHQQYDNSCSSPVLYNNNPKLRSLMEPFIVPAYGQLKQPNTNSTFQSSVISSNAAANTNIYNGLLTTANKTQEKYTPNNENSKGEHNNAGNALVNTSVANVGMNGPNLASVAFSSAALVTENMVHMASNTTNLIQYDNVNAISIFGESRGYLSPEEPRDKKLKAANSLFIISDVNGNLVEYTLDVIIDTNKSSGHRATNDTPIQLKITPKAQWPLQRFVTSDEIKYPIQLENPLISNSSNCKQKMNTNNPLASDLQNSNYSLKSLTPGSCPKTVLNPIIVQTSNSDEWIKQIDVNTHIGPHRRLFMGPQFVFKTFNSNLTTTKLTSTSSSVISDVETPIIDLSGDIELNTLDLSHATTSSLPKSHLTNLTQPVPIAHSLSKTLKAQQKFDCTPTFIEVGAGSFQEGMPVLCGSQGSRGSQKSLNKDANLIGESITESLADAMNDLITTNSANIPFSQRILQQNRMNQMTHHSLCTPSDSSTSAIEITDHRSKHNQPNLLPVNSNQNGCSSISTLPILTPSSVGSNNSAYTVGSYFMINPALSGTSNIETTLSAPTNYATNIGSHAYHISSNSFTSSGSSSNNSSNINNEDDNSSGSSSSSIHNSLTLNKRAIDFNEPYNRSDAPSLDNIQFQDDINLMQ